MAPFTNREHTYVLLEYSMLKMKNLVWCVSDRVIHQHE